MTTPPYARLGVRVNAGAPQYGGITVAHGDTVQLGAESTAYWGAPAAVWQIFDYPQGWTGPGAPWVSLTVPQANGLPDAVVFQYTGNSAPPAFTMPALPYWGKFMFSLFVNGGTIQGKAAPQLYDESTAVQILSPNALVETAFRETSQYGSWRGFAGVLKSLVRLLDGLLSSVPSLSNATPQAVGTATAGVSTSASRADHVHAIGTNLTFPASSTTTITKTTSAGAGNEVTLRGQSGASPGFTGGNLRLGVGKGGTPDVVAGGAMYFDLESDGSQTGQLQFVGGAFGTFLTVSYNDGTASLGFITTKTTLRFDAASTVELYVSGTRIATTYSDGINLAGGKAYQIGGRDLVSIVSSVQQFGSGTAPVEVLCASGQSTKLTVDTTTQLTADGDGITLNNAFCLGTGTTPQGVQTVTGSRGGNAALASLLTAMQAFGLIIDNTTA